MTAEDGLETIRKIMELLGSFSPRVRQRILGYIRHFTRTSKSAEKPREGE
jgi:hypothetical protein